MPFPSLVDATWVNPSSVSYDARELRNADSAMFNGDGTAFGVLGGIVRHGDASLLVTVNTSDVVTVQPGAVVLPGKTGGAEYGCYRTALRAVETGALATRNATNPRIDLVVFQQLDTDVAAASGGYRAQVAIITGTAAASPVAPTLPDLAVELGRINVPAVGGGNATVDRSFARYAASLGGILPVATQARLPTVETKWDRAVAIDTGQEFRWDGTTWLPIGTLVHAASGTRLDATGTPAPSNPAGLKVLTARVSVTLNSSGQASFNFPQALTGVLGISLTTLSGTAISPVINSGNITNSSAAVVFPGAGAITVVFSAIIIGY